MKLSRLSVYGALVLLLQSCASYPLKESTTGVGVEQDSSTVLQKVGNAERGTKIVFKNHPELGSGSFVVGSDYFAASGRVCKHLSSKGRQNLGSIVCRNEHGSWYLPRRLTINPIDSSSSSSAYRETVSRVAHRRQVRTAVPKARGQRSYLLRRGETLWSFAKRSTGNAWNWEKIARFNRIDDAKNVAVGTALAIPHNLPIVED